MYINNVCTVQELGGDKLLAQSLQVVVVQPETMHRFNLYLGGICIQNLWQALTGDCKTGVDFQIVGRDYQFTVKEHRRRSIWFVCVCLFKLIPARVLEVAYPAGSANPGADPVEELILYANPLDISTHKVAALEYQQCSQKIRFR
jgi:hypothetical protein